MTKPARLSLDPALGASPFVAGSASLTVDEAILSRRSLRAFKPDLVPRELVEEILAVASRAPSGSNIQPWQVTVLAGAARDRLVAAMMARFHAQGTKETDRPYNYYPVTWREPYLGRRRKVGWELYASVGIKKGDVERTAVQHGRNFGFFDAPIGMIFTIDRDMELGSWLDYGMFLQNIMLAARARGLDTCPQAAIAYAHDVVRKELAIPDDRQIVCGMALGYARADAPENNLVTVREPVAGFAKFEGL
jgi:nitroreductase